MALSLRRRHQRVGTASNEVDLFLPWWEPPPLAPTPKRRRARIIVSVVVIALLAGVAYGYDRISEQQYFPGTRIGGFVIGSRGVGDAEAVLRERFVVPLHRPLSITGGGLELEATPWDMGLRVDVTSVARGLLREQSSLPLFERMWRRVAGVKGDVPLHLSFDRGSVASFAKRLTRAINREPVDARLEMRGEELNIIPDKPGLRLTQTEAMNAIESSLAKGAPHIELPVHVAPASLRASAFDKTIVVSTIENTLKFYVHGKVARTYGVSTGTGGYPTPLGLFKVVAKEEWPSWYNPHADWSADMPEVIPPGPNNPLGTRALYLSADGILIHGTPHDYSIGSNASHGCIRMHIRDSEAFYPVVPVGTPVLIVG